MLWNIIRDWFVQYVFGGMTSDYHNYGGFLGQTAYWDAGNGFDGFENANTSDALIKSGIYDPLKGDLAFQSIGDWLSSTATIITLIAMCVALFFVVKWLFKMFAGMISGVGR